MRIRDSDSFKCTVWIGEGEGINNNQDNQNNHWWERERERCGNGLMVVRRVAKNRVGGRSYGHGKAVKPLGQFVIGEND